MITIQNLRNRKPTRPYDVRVDRASVLGNPYRVTDKQTREQACDRYHQLLQNIPEDSARYKELQRLITIYKHYGMLNLYCWCAPAQCHAEHIKDYIERNQ